MSGPTTAAAAALSQALAAQASTLLSAQGIHVEAWSMADGQFPYYYDDQGSLNYQTHQWTSQNLAANTAVAQHGGVDFPTLYGQVLNNIKYTLSTADAQTAQNSAYSAQNAANNVVSAWKSAFQNKLPPAQPGSTSMTTPADNITMYMCANWCLPASNQNAMISAPNLTTFFNNAPLSAGGVIPAVSLWRTAYYTGLQITGAQSTADTTLQNLLTNLALKNPTSNANPGINAAVSQLDNPQNTLVNGYQFKQPLNAVQSGLANSGQAVTVSASLSSAKGSTATLSVQGGTGFSVPIADVFEIGIGASASYFSSTVAQNSTSIQIQMSYPGVTPLNFDLFPYSQGSGEGWWFPLFIQQAIQNVGQDPTKTSGWFFSTNNSQDFSSQGNFGYASGVIICQYPTVKVTVQTSAYQSIQSTLQTSASASFSLFGIPLGGASSSTYNHNYSVDASSNSITITLTPPAQPPSNTTSLAWIVGVQTNHPFAKPTFNALALAARSASQPQTASLAAAPAVESDDDIFGGLVKSNRGASRGTAHGNSGDKVHHHRGVHPHFRASVHY